ncbi:dihydrolipoyl dehydrogenase family protein [Ferrimicrobium acidiphilum]|uniref:dihydrolipoyl dehydrogenase family protein n=1 Tax=Ferrimicrobium acidiphilum TaxID=121039 RepID=UPI0023F1FB9C|nr:NAD(P)/FAD-dependent oxidoreductase [Ferrimicrobium acidiphilum]
MRFFDVVLLGAGSAAESIWPHLPGKSVAVVEANRVGGECPFVSCMPSKALLRSAQVRRLVSQAHTLGAVSSALVLDDGAQAFAAAVQRRDRIVARRDDGDNAAELIRSGAVLYRGHGRVQAPGRLIVEDYSGVVEELSYGELVVATGSSPVIPPIPGLDLVPTWVSDEALSSLELPASLAIMGGGAVGCELAQVYATFDVDTTIIEAADHLLPHEDPAVGEVLAEALQRSGVKIRTGAKLARAEPHEVGALLIMDTGAELCASRVLVAVGRQPNVADLGLETLGISPDTHALEVDAQGRVIGVDHLWAVGDVTAIAPFTHTAGYQGRITAANLQGGERRADYRAIPRCVYTDPPFAAVGITANEARSRGLEIREAAMPLNSTARAASDGNDIGILNLIADVRRGILVGASIVGTGADEMIAEAALAIRAEMPISLLVDLVHAFPTYGEAYEPPLRQLLDLDTDDMPMVSGG